MKSLFLLLIYYSMFLYSKFLTGILFNIVNIIMFASLFLVPVVFNIDEIKNDSKKLKIDIKKNKRL